MFSTAVGTVTMRDRDRPLGLPSAGGAATGRGRLVWAAPLGRGWMAGGGRAGGGRAAGAGAEGVVMM